MNNRERRRRNRRHVRAVRDGASWYAYLCYQILRRAGSDRTEALEETFRRYPHALQYYSGRICETPVPARVGAAAMAYAISSEPRHPIF